MKPNRVGRWGVVRVSVVPALFLGVSIAALPADEPVSGVVSVVAQDTAGKAIFTGKGLCQACHGPEAKGTPLAPDLTDAEWLNIEEPTVANIAALVKTGVPQPKQFPTPMLPMGGAQLTEAEVQAVARYVASLSAKSGGSD